MMAVSSSVKVRRVPDSMSSAADTRAAFDTYCLSILRERFGLMVYWSALCRSALGDPRVLLKEMKCQPATA